VKNKNRNGALVHWCTAEPTLLCTQEESQLLEVS